MHLLEIVKDRGLMRAPTFQCPGGGFTPDEIDRAASLEIYGSGFNDPGEDFCLFILKDSDGREIAQRRVEGY